MVMTRQDVIELVEQLPEQQLPIVADFIHSIMLPLEVENGSNKDQKELSQEQKELLDLLNYTVETGITDLARNHDHYLYGLPKR
jgi:hypothetical protein